MGHGWTAEELTKLAGGNVLRVFSEVSLKTNILWSGMKLDRSAVSPTSSSYLVSFEIVNHSLISSGAYSMQLETLVKLKIKLFLQVERVRDMKRMNNEKPFEDIPNFRLPLQTSDEQLYNCSNPV